MTLFKLVYYVDLLGLYLYNETLIPISHSRLYGTCRPP